METPVQNGGVRPWLYGLLVVVGLLCLFAFEVSRSKHMDRLRADNAALRAQPADVEALRARNDELENNRQNLSRSLDLQSMDLAALRDELGRFRARTNEVTSLRNRLVNATIRTESLEQEVRQLRSELEAKPAPPRFGAWIGVDIRDAPPQRLDSPPPGGAEIMQIVGYSPAEKSNLQRGDRIVAVDGEAIAGAGDFKRILAQKPVEQAIVFDVARKDEIVKVHVQPREWPQ
jgi:predicted metalloprotease with PDZ domain